MPVLTPTDHVARVAWLGLLPDRGAGLVCAPAEAVEVGWEGFVGDAHAGLTRPACSRVRAQHRKGTEIRNARQVSILSTEELAATAAALGMADLPPAWVGANLVLEGIEGFTGVPPSSRLIAEGGPALTVDMENAPCRLPAREIEARRPGFGKGYAQAARGRRGVTAWVERPGRLRLGDRLRLHVPPPPRGRWV